ncbi:hypothetical protein ACN24M_19360 [Streptomyces microflavus]|uniref:hypothetical protein n=1 Tax=Streptomyces microflavus TaxID=1919 RepID=UPI003B20C407
MSRTQWCCLTALLAIVMGLLCGPMGAASSYADASPPEAAAGTVREAVTVAAATPAPVMEALDAGTPVPGCREPGDHDSEPGVPTRARAAHDQAPGLAPWGLPVVTGALPAVPPPGLRARAPVPATPTPVELSVLRV